MPRAHWPVVLLLVLAGCAAPFEEVFPHPQDDAAIRFIAIGDMGTGDIRQHRVAEAMAAVCEARGCDFVISNGDNIYELGVSHAYDDQFRTKFEQPYADLEVPFWMTLGNHDIGNRPTTWIKGDHQVAYHYRDDRASDKWQMPDRWYTHDHETVNTTARFVALDTNIVFGEGAEQYTSDPDGQEQGAFVDQALAETNATWRFAHGHHPYISNGQHGDAVPALAAWYETHLCGKVDVLFSGHDHDLQWLEPVDPCGKTQFIVSGAGGKSRSLEPGPHAVLFERGDVYGFVWVEVVGERLTAVFYDERAGVLFEGWLGSGRWTMPPANG